MLSGCDYLGSVKSVGFKKATRLVMQHGTDLKAICHDLEQSGLVFNVERYMAEFREAYYTFKHQIVFDPDSGATCHLNPTEVSLSCAGDQIDSGIAKEICKGSLNPETRSRQDQFQKK